MMNEFPSKYMEVVRESSGSATPLLNGTEYLERLFASGVERRRPAVGCSRCFSTASGIA